MKANAVPDEQATSVATPGKSSSRFRFDRLIRQESSSATIDSPCRSKSLRDGGHAGGRRVGVQSRHGSGHLADKDPDEGTTDDPVISLHHPHLRERRFKRIYIRLYSAAFPHARDRTSKQQPHKTATRDVFLRESTSHLATPSLWHRH